MLTTINVPKRFQVADLEGVYLIYSFDPHSFVRQAINRELTLQEKFFHYGVADDISNILEHHPELSDSDERQFVVFMTEVRREEEPTLDGWRWDKWGDYIGRHTPKHEYLSHEENIDSIFVYHIFWLKN